MGCTDASVGGGQMDRNARVFLFFVVVVLVGFLIALFSLVARGSDYPSDESGQVRVISTGR